jgi:cytochrome c-type biogenesis protein CcmH/NrfG
MVTRDLPVAQLVRTGQRQLERGRPEAALEAFTAALQLDPGNREAAAGAADAGKQIAARAGRQRREAAPPPPPPRDQKR